MKATLILAWLNVFVIKFPGTLKLIRECLIDVVRFDGMKRLRTMKKNLLKSLDNKQQSRNEVLGTEKCGEKGETK